MDFMKMFCVVILKIQNIFQNMQSKCFLFTLKREIDESSGFNNLHVER
jgi:hypothetical protein